jgi:hypothetical protein
MISKKVLTLEEAKLKTPFRSYLGVYEYKNKNGYYSLVDDGIDVLRGKKAVDCLYYGEGVYGWMNKSGYWHLTINGVDVLEGKKAVDCLYYGEGVYKWENENGYYALAIGGVDVLKGKKAVWCWHFGDGVYQWKPKGGFYHLVIGGVDVLKNKKAVDCYYYGEGVYKWKNEKGEWHEEQFNLNSMAHNQTFMSAVSIAKGEEDKPTMKVVKTKVCLVELHEKLQELKKLCQFFASVEIGGYPEEDPENLEMLEELADQADDSIYSAVKEALFDISEDIFERQRICEEIRDEIESKEQEEYEKMIMRCETHLNPLI